LTAFAQLACLRLQTARALICLVDDDRQYILAEAVPGLSVDTDPQAEGVESLWLGSAIIPRVRCICPLVLDVTDQHPTVVIGDLSLDERFAAEWFVGSQLTHRFYAAVPLKHPKGSIVGALAVYDPAPRLGISASESGVLHGLADSIIRHLIARRSQQETDRGESMVRGLASFIEGSISLLPNALPKPSREPSSDTYSFAKATSSTKQPQDVLPEDGPDSARDLSLGLQEKLLSAGVKHMFARAANIIREASSLDGVIFFDASLVTAPKPVSSDRADSAGDNSQISDLDFTSKGGSVASIDSILEDQSLTSSFHPRGNNQLCHLLCFADERKSSIEGNFATPEYLSLTESSLKILIDQYPDGHVINFGDFDSTNSTDPCFSLSKPDDLHDHLQLLPEQTAKDIIQRIVPRAETVMLLPLWNYELSRWFAFCLGWTTDLALSQAPEINLTYMKAFGGSIMREVSRLDAETTQAVKTTFVESISHELRHPLHGIIGGVQIVQDTDLNAFQASMLSSIEMSGRTLLDTIDHVLDYSKINNSAKPKLHRRDRRTRHRRLPNSQRDMVPQVLTDNPVDLALSIEEVVETVFAGLSYKVMSIQTDQQNADTSINGRPNESSPHNHGENDRKNIWVSLDISRRPSWDFHVPSGAWRRIVMNIFGNALKFTHSGSIRVSLEARDVTSQPPVKSKKTYASTNPALPEAIIKMTIADTGIGVSSEFLNTQIFKAFSQEDSFFEGSGLGLNIVQQLVDSLDGNINIRSERNSGTVVEVELPLYSAGNQISSQEIELEIIAQVSKNAKSRKVCVFGRPYDDPMHSNVTEFNASLTKSLSTWYGIKADMVTTWEGHHDLVICSEPRFDHLEDIRSQMKPGQEPPVVVFVALDAIEASALRNDSRVTDGASPVEIITQPYVYPYEIPLITTHNDVAADL
jgi:signal transduction histidine kinase